MLRVLVGSRGPKVAAAEESLAVSDFRSHLFFSDDRGTPSHARSSTGKGTILELPVTHFEGEQTHHLMEKDEQLPAQFMRMMSNDTTTQELPHIRCPCCCPNCYSAFESGKTTAAAYDFHFQPERQTHHSNKPQEMHFIKVEECSQFEALSAHPDVPQTAFVDDDLHSSDAASDLNYQTDDINDLFAISEPVSSLIAEGATPHRAPTTIFEEDISQGSEPPLQEAEWATVGETALSESPRSSLESPEPTAGNVLASASTSLPLLAAQVHQVSDSSTEGPSHDQSIWDTVDLSNEARFYGEINSALAQLAAANIHSDTPTFGNDGTSVTHSLLLPWDSERTNSSAMLSVGSGRTVNQGCNESFPIPGFYQYHKRRHRHNEPWPLPTASDKGAVGQGKLLGRPLTCLRDKRNAFLIDCKLRGLSYKDIKRIGGFKEAESTLRGRFRTLTKSKEQRVRKPQWHQNDIRLLCEAVNVLSEAAGQGDGHYSFCWAQIDNQLPKVSWKRVAQYIRAHGGSYHFGNATCKKKWCEIHGVKI
ncbi:hypothetical protein AbraIFM66950_005225 [Aspergillus brasiliensis]|nr:hypothetical protein AbraIFM66950_005225 [Aspergillus brasiliensis]